MGKYQVYAKTDEFGRIIAVNSSAFLQDLTGWVQVDEGAGDRYHHAQGNYLLLPLMDDAGAWRYKLENGSIVERSPEEMAEDVAPEESGRSDSERLADLEEALDLLLSGVTE